jgi:hypothetical protein
MIRSRTIRTTTNGWSVATPSFRLRRDRRSRTLSRYSGGNTISGYAVDGGTVTELPDSPTPGPAGPQPIGIVVT